eukprot:2072889-Amphidinium_carterae.1
MQRECWKRRVIGCYNHGLSCAFVDFQVAHTNHLPLGELCWKTSLLIEEISLALAETCCGLGNMNRKSHGAKLVTNFRQKIGGSEPAWNGKRVTSSDLKKLKTDPTEPFQGMWWDGQKAWALLKVFLGERMLNKSYKRACEINLGYGLPYLRNRSEDTDRNAVSMVLFDMGIDAHGRSSRT